MREKGEKLNIQVLVENNEKTLRELARPFESFSRLDPRSSGLFSKPRDFRSECRDLDWENIRPITEKVKKANWEALYGYYVELEISLTAYPREKEALYHGFSYKKHFQSCINRAVKTGLFDEHNPEKVEKATIHYLRYLELRHKLLEKMVSALIDEKNKEDEERDFSVRQQLMEMQAHSLFDELAELQKKLQHYTVICHDYLWRRPEKNSGSDLKSAIANLDKTYTTAYQAINPLWRWIKYLCQNSERTQEIVFLQAVSNAADSDAIRLEAIRVMHNKIASSEPFGATSKLKSMLACLGDTAEESLDDVGSLADFIDQRDELKNSMPPSFAAYYDATKNLSRALKLQ